jgi:hypothetical protein
MTLSSIQIQIVIHDEEEITIIGLTIRVITDKKEKISKKF